MTAFITQTAAGYSNPPARWQRSWHSRSRRQGPIAGPKREAATLKVPSLSSQWKILCSPSDTGLKSTALQMLDPSNPITTTTTTTTFEPVLNVPALFVFVLIMGLFALLQSRVRAIEVAADERTSALQRLRTLKAQELSDPTVMTEQVRDALQQYEAAYNRVEALRTILPGVRVIPPPSQSLTQARQRENEAAAQQFLGIEQSPPPPLEPKTEQGMSPLLTAVLILVAFSQIALLVLLMATDPMVSSSSQWNQF